MLFFSSPSPSRQPVQRVPCRHRSVLRVAYPRAGKGSNTRAGRWEPVPRPPRRSGKVERGPRTLMFPSSATAAVARSFCAKIYRLRMTPPELEAQHEAGAWARLSPLPRSACVVPTLPAVSGRPALISNRSLYKMHVITYFEVVKGLKPYKKKNVPGG